MGKKISWVFNNMEIIIGTACTVLMIALMFLQVISRYVFNYAIPWTEELALICFVVSIYFGCSLAVIKDKHLSIDIVSHYASFKWKKMMGIAANLFFIAFCIYIIDPLMIIIDKLYKGDTKMIVTGIPQYIIYSIVVFCLGLTSIRLIQKSIMIYQQKEENKVAKNAILDLDNL